MNRHRLAACFGALALAASLAACSDDGGSAEEGPAAPVQGEVVEAPTGALTDVTIRQASHIHIAGVLRVEADQPVAVEAEAVAAGGGPRVDVPRTTRTLPLHRIPVVGLRAETTYDVTVRAFDERGREAGTAVVRLTTGSLPEWLPDLRVDVADTDRMAPGYTLLDVQRWGVEVPEGQAPGALLVLDPEGEVVWYHVNRLGAGDARMTEDGTIVNLYAPFGFEEVDLLGAPVESWTWGDAADARPDGPVVVDSPTYELVSFHHEVAPQPDGNILVFSRYQRDLTEAEQEAYCPGDPVEFGIREDLLMEITREGEIVHEWSLHDVVDPAEVPGRELCAVDFEDYRDWAHGNGAVIDRERNQVLVTARHIDLLFAFRYEADASGPSGELLWAIGPETTPGTLPLEGEPSYGLHAPEVEPDGTIMVFDNGNDRPGTPEPYSRAVRYEVDQSSPDPADWTARQVWEFRTEDRETGGPLYADFLGDADLQPNGNVLIGFGGINQTEPPARGRIVEVVPRGAAGGDIVFDVTIPETWTSYRSERLPSLYTGPRWRTS